MNVTFTNKDISKILGEFYQLVRHGRLTEIEAYLHKKPDAYDMFLVTGVLHDESFSLLMLAALNGHDGVVRLIINRTLTNKENIEQEGCVRDMRGYLTKNVTALWCALDRRHFHVARTLIDLGGADINHGPRFSLLINAIMRRRFDIVYYLVENGYADVNRSVTNDNCNISSLFLCAISGLTEIAAYLIARGANIDYQTPTSHLTPLFAAGRYGHFAIVRLLVSKGASSNVKTSSGITPLMIAAKHDHLNTVEFLLRYHHDETTFDDLELTASSFVLTNDDDLRHRAEKMVNLLRISLRARILFNRPKIVSQAIPAYDNQRECQSESELDQIAYDNDRLYVEALLIRERILLPRKDAKLFQPLLEHAIVLAERVKFDLCLNLLIHTFYLYQQMEICTGLHRFVWMFCRMLNANIPINPTRFLEVCRLVFEPSQQNTNEANIVNTVCLLAIAAKVLEQTTLCNQDRHSIIQWIRELTREQRRTEKEQTLLHLTVDIQTYWNIDYRAVDVRRALKFPNLAATRLLVCYGMRWINLDAVDQVQRNTPLHNISQSWMYDDRNDKKSIIELLINAGAHIDFVNANGYTPIDVATDDETRTLLRSKQILPRLKCLCARAISHERIAFDDLWPMSTPMNTFLRLHGGFKRKRSMSDYSSFSWGQSNDLL
ncbi:unnamed protein product [Rotaria magnacalcarata]|uniref:Uncharacterized protein n=3 Tax=Rotaria magnacalcarata TaxID=392030 RepID=A0A816TR11_9BILA|nr:unnamed protein product [Rotaria magnacalcarata]CAF2098478.1 unnamed protein product [Rotaria magnacalcarata]CAF4004537.1 unnamed protein product [Rotaria magnacalcarata]